jgi:hypothetical protein
LLDLETGQELGRRVVEYSHGVMTGTLPGTSELLPLGWAL